MIRRLYLPGRRWRGSDGSMAAAELSAALALPLEQARSRHGTRAAVSVPDVLSGKRLPVGDPAACQLRRTPLCVMTGLRCWRFEWDPARQTFLSSHSCTTRPCTELMTAVSRLEESMLDYACCGWDA
eukprot:6206657-Pleurochrysis_carterae.AAC.2